MSRARKRWPVASRHLLEQWENHHNREARAWLATFRRLHAEDAELRITVGALATLLAEHRARDPREVVRETFAALAPLDRGTLLGELCSIHRKASPGSAARERDA